MPNEIDFIFFEVAATKYGTGSTQPAVIAAWDAVEITIRATFTKPTA